MSVYWLLGWLPAMVAYVFVYEYKHRCMFVATVGFIL